jgi:hypothetical protein
MHQFLHTCMHFAWSHCFGRGAWRMVRDVDFLLSDPDLDPEAIVREARNARASTSVYWTLAVLRALTERVVPEALMDGLQAGPPEIIRRPLLRHLVTDAQGESGTPGTRRLRRALWSIAIRPRRSGHGTSRPWTGAERWEAVADPFGLDRVDVNRFATRIRGFLTYSSQVILGVGPG